MRRRSSGLGVLLASASLLAACSSAPAGTAGAAVGSDRAALDALTATGVNCRDYGVRTVDAVPYTVIGCADLQIEWFADAAAYENAWAADCAAVAPTGRTSMAGIDIVKGPDWLVRTAGDVTRWPVSPTADEVAGQLGGTHLTAADYCRQLGVWS